MNVAPDVSVSLRDYWRFSPTQDQYESDEYMQNGTYRFTLFFSRFGITSYRWKMLTKKNKLEEIGRTADAQKLAKYE